MANTSHGLIGPKGEIWKSTFNFSSYNLAEKAVSLVWPEDSISQPCDFFMASKDHGRYLGSVYAVLVVAKMGIFKKKSNLEKCFDMV